MFVIVKIADYSQDEYKQIDAGPKPSDTTQTNFSYGAVEKICSKEIEGTWSLQKYDWGAGEGYSWEFIPKNIEEMRKYCRDGAVIEYKSVIDILKREDVIAVIDKYSPYEASVRALGHKYIRDKDYLKRILPEYDSMVIDCIIVVHSPEGTRFFLENGEVHDSHDDHKYIEVTSKEFLNSLNSASDEDVTAFWLGLH